MARRTVALYREQKTGRTQFIGIESVYTVVDGKQINIPQIIDDLRKKSRKHELFCPCGCGSNLILVAGDRNLREQHFRIWDDGKGHKCHAVDEGDVSIDSKVVLKCWLDDKIRDPGILTRVPIRSVDNSDRKYEFSFLSVQRGIALSYSHKRENLYDEKIGILENNKKNFRVYYIVDFSNEGCNGQYPEWLMKIQRIQGYCLFLHIDGSDYSKAEMKAVFYSQDLDRNWMEQKIVEGPLKDYWIDQNKNLLFQDRILEKMKLEAEKTFRTKQEQIRRKRIEDERQKKEKQEWIRQRLFLKEEENHKKEEALNMERMRRAEEAKARREAEETRQRREAERLREKEKQQEKEFKVRLAEQLDQQEVQVRDPKGKRWIRCEYCGRAMPEEMFSFFGGPGRMNLGTCQECEKNNPAAREIVRPVFRKRRENEGRNSCPLCGGALMKKNGKFGPFWGCSNYPRCRFTRNV